MRASSIRNRLVCLAVSIRPGVDRRASAGAATGLAGIDVPGDAGPEACW